MQKSKCTHIRVRDDNDYNLDAEALIKSIEKEHKIDFRSLPQWKELVKRLHVSQTDYKRRVQYANLQKAAIIDKLYMQSTRPSPFQLSEDLARTASKWQRMKDELKSAKIIPEDSPEEVSSESVREEVDTVHPNTENVTSDTTSMPEPSKLDVGVQYSVPQVIPPKTPTNLPVMICTNIHKTISTLDSRTSQLSFHLDRPQKMQLKDSEAEIKEWLPSTTAVVCNPTPIHIHNNTLDEQSLLFSLINCTGEYLHIRFKYVTEKSPFVRAKILPIIPKRLYPGIPFVFKLVFKLKSGEPFQSGLYFRVGRDVYANAPTVPLFLPIISTFGIDRVIRISDTVTIPPVYPWHITFGPESKNPRGVLRIAVGDSYSYHLHIYKRENDLSTESNVLVTLSMRPSTLNTESMEDRDTFIQSEATFAIDPSIHTRSSTKSSLAKTKPTKNKSPVNATTNTKPVPVEIEINEQIVIDDMIGMIIEDIVQLSLDTFVFDSTYEYLHPNSKKSINVFFTKAEHIGYHQSYYDLELIDPETETVAFNKTIKVFAEVLPNPIQITPIILDMSDAPNSHGYYKSQFVITNTHKVFSVTAHIKLTTKMKKLFHVTPMKTVVPQQSSITFQVSLCSRHYLAPSLANDFVHFTFKIVIRGYNTVFQHFPTIFYEMIAPCAAEFKEVYNEKYFRDTDTDLTSADSALPTAVS